MPCLLIRKIFLIVTTANDGFSVFLIRSFKYHNIMTTFQKMIFNFVPVDFYHNFDKNTIMS